MKKLIALLLAALMVFSMAACGTKPEAPAEEPAKQEADPEEETAPEEEAAPADKNIKVGFVCMNLANPFFIAVQNGFETACKELGVQCMVVDSQYDVSKQVSDLETLVNDGYDGIMISPIDQNALLPIVEKANEAGIVTSCMAQSVDNTDFGIIAAEHDYGVQIGTNAANWINAELADLETVKVAIISQDNVEDVIARADGIEETLKSLCPNVEIVARQAGDTAEKGLNIIEGVLAATPDLNVVVGVNDSGGVGGYQAMVNAGFTGDDPVAIFSGDATDEALNLMKEENSIYRGTVDLNPFQAAYDYAYKMVEMIKNGQKNAEQEVMGFSMILVPQADLLDGTYSK